MTKKDPAKKPATKTAKKAPAEKKVSETKTPAIVATEKDVSQKVKWIKEVMGDRLADEDDLVVRDLAVNIVLLEFVERRLFGAEDLVVEVNGQGQQSQYYKLFKELSKARREGCKIIGMTPTAKHSKDELKGKGDQPETGLAAHLN